MTTILLYVIIQDWNRRYLPNGQGSNTHTVDGLLDYSHEMYELIFFLIDYIDINCDFDECNWAY